MIIKCGKFKFVRTILSHKKTERLNHRINPVLKKWMIIIFPDKKESEIIDSALAEYLFRNGLNLIEEDGEMRFRKEATKLHVKGHCKNCHYYKNW